MGCNSVRRRGLNFPSPAIISLRIRIGLQSYNDSAAVKGFLRPQEGILKPFFIITYARCCIISLITELVHLSGSPKYLQR